MTIRRGVPGTSHLAPTSSLPLAYFAFAHIGLAATLLALVVRPDLPAGFFYHPRMIALVHGVTLVWLTGSILGAFHIVAPLALGLPMRVGAADWIAFGAFAIGTTGMVSHFWIGEYSGMVWSAAFVVFTIGWVAVRALTGLPRATAPWGVKVHVAFAFVNILVAAAIGIAIGLERSRSVLGISPIALTYAHAHVAAVGWVLMMVIGLAYRLVPMMLPAAMPSGDRLAASALFIQIGVMAVAAALIGDVRWLPAGTALIVAGLACFVVQMRGTVRHRMPRPPALPSRDWATWQTHAAFAWLVVAVGCGIVLSFDVLDDQRIRLSWCYGVAGLVGFLSQVVAGIQGRLVPMYAWYRASATTAWPRPSVHELVSAPYARAIFCAWLAGVPLLAWGLGHQQEAAVAAGAASLAIGVLAGGAYIARIVRRAAVPSSAGGALKAGPAPLEE